MTDENARAERERTEPAHPERRDPQREVLLTPGSTADGAGTSETEVSAADRAEAAATDHGDADGGGLGTEVGGGRLE
jgi:hypothetical protein